MRHAIKKAILEIAGNLGYQDVKDIVLERPSDMAKGDFATNIALVLSKKVGKSPLALAIEFVDKLKEKNIEEVDKIEVAGPGFINFFVTRKATKEAIAKILEEGDLYGTGTTLVENGVSKKVLFEYTDPNPFKVFHIGHLMANTIGEALARITESQGAEVKRFCYQGDVGRHVALTIWGLRFMKESIPTEAMPLSDRVAYFGKAYALGATEYKRVEDEAKKSNQVGEDGLPNSSDFVKVDTEVQEINKRIYDKSDAEINEIYNLGKEWSLLHFEHLYDILGTKFDRYFFESQCADDGLKIVKENTKPNGKSVFEESNGATVFNGEQYGLNTRVFITRKGVPTYEGKEIGLAPKKYEAFKYDDGVTVTANEQDDFFRVTLKAIQILFPEFGNKARHVSHGMLKLTTGKMSSRTGDVITGESLLVSMIDLALARMQEREMSEDDKKKAAELIAVAAIKYTILRQSIGKDIVFDPEKSLSFEGDSGPYLQYSCVRAGSVLEKARREGVVEVVDTTDIKVVPSETFGKLSKLENLLVRFPETVEKAQMEEAPHAIATYLMELAASFNSFYASVPIVKIDDFESRYKVAVVRSFTIVMRNGLRILGIKVPEKM